MELPPKRPVGSSRIVQDVCLKA
uniref:Uncharacterized protein n=1 Tax=Rhizophora mucronata TaxID=61149 RepID=A0A2P2KTQ7_RHIMU